MCRFKYNSFKWVSRRPAFTMVEVAAAVLLLGIILASVMVLMNRYVDAVIEMQLREEAFELARSNMEQLLSENRLSDMDEFGTSETNSDIEWETRVEPFYEPVTDQMWIRAVCSAGYTDNKGEFQNIELEHWITNLTAAQVKQILAQQAVEEEYAELLAGGEYDAIQETTLAYLKQEGLDDEAYRRFIEKQRRQKLEYIAEKGYAGYEQYLQSLEGEENLFLKELGVDFDAYNDFAASYVPKSDKLNSMLSDLYGDQGPGSSTGDSPGQPSSDYEINWNKVPPELVPLVERLLGIKKPGS